MKTQDVKNLSEIIHEKLNIDFESFVNGINDEAKFNDYRSRLQILENKKMSALNETTKNDVKKTETTTKPSEIPIKIEEPYNDPGSAKINQKTVAEKEKAQINQNQLSQNVQNQQIQTKANKTQSNQNLPQTTQNQKGDNISENNDGNELILCLHPKNDDDLYFFFNDDFCNFFLVK